MRPVYHGPIPREQRYYAAMQRGVEAVMRVADEEIAAALNGVRPRSCRSRVVRAGVKGKR